MNNDETTGKLPLGIIKQAVMKLDSLMVDFNEIKEDPDVDDQDRIIMDQMKEIASTMTATLVNMVKREMDEEEFLSEEIAMDVIDEYPEPNIDIMDSNIE